MSQWQITLKWLNEQQQARNVLCYDGVNDTEVDWPQIAQEVGAAFAASLANRYTPGTGLLGINVLRLDPGFLSLEFPISTTGIYGTDGDEPMAATVAPLITLNGELPLAPNRGRIYLPSPNRDNIGANGLMVPDWISAVNSWMSSMVTLDDGSGAVLNMAIRSRTYPDGADVAFNPVASWTVRAVPATQRKRRIGVGI